VPATPVEDLIADVFAGYDREAPVEQAVRRMLTGNAGELSESDTVPGEVLRRVCITADSGEGGRVGRVCLRGGRVSGEFNLTALTSGRVWLPSASIGGDLNFGAILVIGLCLGYFAKLDSCTPGPATKTCGDFVVPAADAPPYRPVQYSLDAFLPVDLGQTSEWHPGHGWPALVVTIETIMGWLATGVLVAAATGVLRKD
jgi:hypothetical protein